MQIRDWRARSEIAFAALSSLCGALAVFALAGHADTSHGGSPVLGVLFGLAFFALPALAAMRHVASGKRGWWRVLLALAIIQTFLGVFSFVGFLLLPPLFTILATIFGFRAAVGEREQPVAP